LAVERADASSRLSRAEVDRPDLSRPERVELSSGRCAAVEILDSERTI
jgi:hypothetical protein